MQRVCLNSSYESCTVCQFCDFNVFNIPRKYFLSPWIYVLMLYSRNHNYNFKQIIALNDVFTTLNLQRIFF